MLRCNWSIHFLVSFNSDLTYWKFVYLTNKFFVAWYRKDLDSPLIEVYFVDTEFQYSSINCEFQTDAHHVIFLLCWPRRLFRFSTTSYRKSQMNFWPTHNMFAFPLHLRLLYCSQYIFLLLISVLHIFWVNRLNIDCAYAGF